MPNYQPPERSTPESQNLVLQLHLAEYLALTNRGTNWLALESGMWALMMIFVSLVPSLWGKLPRDMVIWGSFGALQAMLFVWSNMLFEQYSSICYIEQKLRPLVRSVIGAAEFWQYEEYVGSRRPQNQPFWYETAPSFAVFGVLLGLVLYRLQKPHPVREYFEFAVNVGMSCAYVWGSIRVVKVRRHLTQPFASKLAV